MTTVGDFVKVDKKSLNSEELKNVIALDMLTIKKE